MDSGQKLIGFFFIILLIGWAISIGGGLNTEIVAATNHQEVAVESAELGQSTVETGETVEVTAEIRNPKNSPESFEARLRVDGEIGPQETVDIPANSTETVTFEPEFDETGEKTVSVNNELAGTVSVLAPANFVITDASLSRETILEGESVVITAEIENTGDVAGTFDADLRINGETAESKSRTIDGGTSELISFQRTFDEAGSYTIGVGSTTAGELTVDQPATFSITETAIASTEILETESTTITATVENTGDREGIFQAVLEIDGETVESRPVTVAGGEARDIQFTRTFEETGERRVTVGGQFAGDVTVLAPPELVVTSATVEEETILETDSVTVTADIENIGDVVGTGSATLAVDGESVESKSVSVNGGNSRELSFQTPVPDAGIYEFSVNGETAGEVTAEQPATLSVENAAVSEKVILENNSVDIGARLENTGDRSGTFSVGLAIDGSETASRELGIAAGDSAIVEFEHRFDTAGMYNISIADVTAGSVLVEQPASLELTGTELEPETVLLTDSVEIKPTVRNSGDRTGTVSLVVAAENDTIERRNVSVGPQSTETVQVNESFDKTGEYTITVNDNTAGTVRVEEPPDFEVTEATVPADWAAPGTTTTLEAVVENPSQWRVTRPVNVTVDDELVTQEQVTLGPGENKEVTIEFNATGGSVSVNGYEAGTLAASEITEDDSTPNDTEDDEENTRLLVTVPVLVAMIGAGWYIFTNMGSGGREI